MAGKFVLDGLDHAGSPADAILKEEGSTTHFTVSYDAGLGANGPVLAQAVLQTCEADYDALQAWFGDISIGSLPFQVDIVPGSNGASHASCAATGLTCDAFDGTNADLVRMLVVAEADEVFMANQAKGWNCGWSNGEALSRILAADRYPAQLNGFATPSSWLNSDRQDFVSVNDQTDRNYVSTGCATLFINFLRYQLGYSLASIVQAGGATLEAVFENLTGKSGAFAPFAALLQRHYPQGTQVQLGNDNPFPLAEFQHVVYLTADGHVHEMYFPIGGGSWAQGDLTAGLGAPAAAAGSALTSWSDRNFQHVVYLTADGHVHEMYFPIGGGSWAQGDLTAGLGAPAAAAGSALTSWSDRNFQHVVYLTADGHVHEMYFPIGGGSWAHGDLTAGLGAPAAAPGSALTSWSDRNFQHVVYLTADGHVHEMYFPIGGGSWAHGDLTASMGAPAAAPGSALTSWSDRNFQHVVYLTADGHVHEMYFPIGGGSWAHGDLTASMGAPAAVAGSALTSWSDRNFQHVVYLTADGHVHEMYFPIGGGSWAHGDLTASMGAPAAVAGSALTSWSDRNFQHVVYLTADGHVHEMYFPIGGGSWAHGDLTAGLGAPAAVAGSALTSWADVS